MKYKKHIFFSFFLFSYILSSFSQDIDIEQLFENKEYSKVITILLDKDTENKLSLRDYYLLTKSYGKIKRYTDGLVYSNEMIKECLKRNDTANLIKAYNLKAENLVDLNRYKEGVKFCKSISNTFRPQDSIELQGLFFKWGILHYLNHEYQEAYEIYNKITLKKYRKLRLFTHNYGLTLEGLNKFDEALILYKKSVQIAYDSNMDPSTSLFNIANVYIEQKKWRDAQIYLDSAAFINSKNRTLEKEQKLYEHYFDFYSQQKMNEEAALYITFLRAVDEELFQKKTTEKLQAIERSNKRELMLNTQLETTKKEKLWGTIILLFVILALLSILFLFKYRNIKAAHENILTEQKLLRSQMTPHFIFNSLSVLQGMILNKEDKKAVRYLSKFSKLLRLILENSREKLVPIDEELKAIQNYVDLHNMRRSTSFKYTLTLDDDIEDLGLLIPPMLIQPFVENSIEHGFKNDFEHAEISIDITFNQDRLDCIIKDNGIGFNASKSKSTTDKKSLSTKITSERLKIFSKEYKVKTRVLIQDRSVFNQQGTQINLTLPYKIDQDA